MTKDKDSTEDLFARIAADSQALVEGLLAASAVERPWDFRDVAMDDLTPMERNVVDMIRPRPFGVIFERADGPVICWTDELDGGVLDLRVLYQPRHAYGSAGLISDGEARVRAEEVAQAPEFVETILGPVPKGGVADWAKTPESAAQVPLVGDGESREAAAKRIAGWFGLPWESVFGGSSIPMLPSCPTCASLFKNMIPLDGPVPNVCDDAWHGTGNEFGVIAEEWARIGREAPPEPREGLLSVQTDEELVRATRAAGGRIHEALALELAFRLAEGLSEPREAGTIGKAERLARVPEVECVNAVHDWHSGLVDVVRCKLCRRTMAAAAAEFDRVADQTAEGGSGLRQQCRVCGHPVERIGDGWRHVVGSVILDAHDPLPSMDAISGSSYGMTPAEVSDLMESRQEADTSDGEAARPTPSSWIGVQGAYVGPGALPTKPPASPDTTPSGTSITERSRPRSAQGEDHRSSGPRTGSHQNSMLDAAAAVVRAWNSADGGKYQPHVIAAMHRLLRSVQAPWRVADRLLPFIATVIEAWVQDRPDEEIHRAVADLGAAMGMVVRIPPEAERRWRESLTGGVDGGGRTTAGDSVVWTGVITISDQSAEDRRHLERPESPVEHWARRCVGVWKQSPKNDLRAAMSPVVDELFDACLSDSRASERGLRRICLRAVRWTELGIANSVDLADNEQIARAWRSVEAKLARLAAAMEQTDG
jgi:hypothetical protein